PTTACGRPISDYEAIAACARPVDATSVDCFVLRCARDDAPRHLAGGPIVTVKLPTPSISHSSVSPGTVAATPDGVPVMMISPAASATVSDSLPMTSATFQIICARSPSCRSLPLALSAMRPLLG